MSGPCFVPWVTCSIPWMFTFQQNVRCTADIDYDIQARADLKWELMGENIWGWIGGFYGTNILKQPRHFETDVVIAKVLADGLGAERNSASISILRLIREHQLIGKPFPLCFLSRKGWQGLSTLCMPTCDWLVVQLLQRWSRTRHQVLLLQVRTVNFLGSSLYRITDWGNVL